MILWSSTLYFATFLWETIGNVKNDSLGPPQDSDQGSSIIDRSSTTSTAGTNYLPLPYQRLRSTKNNSWRGYWLSKVRYINCWECLWSRPNLWSGFCRNSQFSSNHRKLKTNLVKLPILFPDYFADMIVLDDVYGTQKWIPKQQVRTPRHWISWICKLLSCYLPDS